LQHVGEALIAVGVAGMESDYRDVASRLRALDDVGDVELADLLGSRLDGPAQLARPAHADLDQVANLISGDAAGSRPRRNRARQGARWR